MNLYMHTYAELAKIGHKYHNDTNFCSLVATCVATGQPYSKVYRAYQTESRQIRRGTHMYQQVKVLAKFGKKMSTDWDKTNSYKTLTSVANTCHTWGNGVYWIYVRGHVAAVRDGVLEDWSAIRKYRGKVQTIHKLEDI